MSSKEIELLEVARKTPFPRLSDFDDEMRSKEAKNALEDIRRKKYRREEFEAGMI